MLLGWSAGREWLLQVVGLEMSDDEFVDEFERVTRTSNACTSPACGTAAKS